MRCLFGATSVPKSSKAGLLKRRVPQTDLQDFNGPIWACMHPHSQPVTPTSPLQGTQRSMTGNLTPHIHHHVDPQLHTPLHHNKGSRPFRCNMNAATEALVAMYGWVSLFWQRPRQHPDRPARAFPLGPKRQHMPNSQARVGMSVTACC